MYVQLRFTNSTTIYAAKVFYDIGTDDINAVSPEDNLQLLKEELLRQLAIRAAVKAFNQAADEAKIAIYGESSFDLSLYSTSLINHRLTSSRLIYPRMHLPMEQMGAEMAKRGLSAPSWILLGCESFREQIEPAPIVISLEKPVTHLLTLRCLILALSSFRLIYRVCLSLLS